MHNPVFSFQRIKGQLKAIVNKSNSVTGIIFNEGISQIGEIIDIGVDKGILDKAGAWYSYKGERIGQGREGVKHFLRDNPDLAREVRRLILSPAGIGEGLPDGATAAEPVEPKRGKGGKRAGKTDEPEADDLAANG